MRSLAAGVAILFATSFAAVAGADTPPRTLEIHRIDAKIQVDGKLDEPAWQQATMADGFVQTEPDEGKPTTERTEAFLFYSNEKLYIGFKCFDSEPSRIVKRYGTHDAVTNSDGVNIFLDPFGDRRTGYFFRVNARGVQVDGLLSEASGLDRTWDGIWESATRIEPWGWSAEVAIPFKSIRFQTGQTWGINLGREIVRKNERANWQLVTRFDGFFRPSKAGLMTGLADVKPARNIELIPYFSTRVRRGAPDPFDNSEKYEGGVDLRWGLLPNFTANVSVNPDFADTEADEINISISRFELFFPEKRAFFNEGSNFFSTPLNLFFTRRVGARLPDGNPQRILLGAKLTGKMGPWSLGLLEARTQGTHFSTTDEATGQRVREFAPAANFFVLRVKRDILKSSALGFITVNRGQPAGDIGAAQRVHAVDLDITSGEHMKWRTQLAYSQSPTGGAEGLRRLGFRSNYNYSTSNWETNWRYKYLGPGFDVSSIGFEPETNRHSAQGFARWTPIVDRWGVHQAFLALNQDISVLTDGRLDDSGSDADVSVRFRNFWFAGVRYSYDRVRFNDFTPDFQPLAPTHIYIEPRIRFSLQTNENRAVFLSYTFAKRKFVQFAENFYGREQQHQVELTARILDRTRLQFNGTFVREFLLNGTPFQDRRLFITRLNHQFTQKFRTRVLAQASSDRHGRNFNVNSIVAYDFTARSAFIIGYNYQRGSPLQPGDLGNEFFAKFSYLFHF